MSENSPKRPRFFEGQILNSKDLDDMLKYVLEKRKRFNRYLYDAGIIDGLHLSITDEKLTVQSGFALDCLGREIIVPQLIVLDLPKEKHPVFVVFRYKEIKTDPVPAISGSDEIGEGGTSQGVNYSRIQETFEFSYNINDPFQGHNRSRCLWRACGKNHALLAGRIKFKNGGWIVDRRCRPLRYRQHGLLRSIIYFFFKNLP
jgi:hypothetical protein